MLRLSTLLATVRLAVGVGMRSLAGTREVKRAVSSGMSCGGSTAPAGDFAKAASAGVKILAGHSPERVTAICPACATEIRLPHDPARMAVATRFARAPAPLLHPYLWQAVAVAAGSRPPSRHAFTALLRQYHGVDHVNHTVRGRDVCLDDLGVLDRYRPVVRGDG
jgi:hypothetical protein